MTKMCKYWGKDNECRTKGHNVCAKSNSFCEIIPPKPKYKIVKGWAEVDKVSGEWKFREPQFGTLEYPAELRIKVKHLKGDK